MPYMSEELLRCYIPDAYQKNIYEIDYGRLKEKGIKLITFDIDDTLVPKGKTKLPHNAIALISKLKNLGFEVMLLSDAEDTRVQGFADCMGVNYIARDRRPPSSKVFEEILTSRGLEKNQMAYIGNNIVNDVAAGNVIGVTTCLVRPVAHKKEIVSELKKRGMFRERYEVKKGDQYYQLGEFQRN